jgi:hypothetical protein
MKYGRTEADTLRLNGWGVGDILEGQEGQSTHRIWITSVGQETFLCRWDYSCSGDYGEEEGNTTLDLREWRKVGHKPIETNQHQTLVPLEEVHSLMMHLAEAVHRNATDRGALPADEVRLLVDEGLQGYPAAGWCRDSAHRSWYRRTGEVCSCQKYSAAQLLAQLDETLRAQKAKPTGKTA